MRDQRSALRARRTQRFIELQQMDGRAVCRRRFEMRRDKKLAQIFSNSIEPGFRCGIVSGKRAQKWIAHAQASVSASRFGRQHLEAGTKRRVRSRETKFSLLREKI